jgi:hypothetical protein
VGCHKITARKNINCKCFETDFLGNCERNKKYIQHVDVATHWKVKEYIKIDLRKLGFGYMK